MTQDLVCRIDIDEQDSRFFSDYGNETYYFCSADCKRKFDDHPDDYIRDQAKRDLGL